MNGIYSLFFFNYVCFFLKQKNVVFRSPLFKKSQTFWLCFGSKLTTQESKEKKKWKRQLNLCVAKEKSNTHFFILKTVIERECV